MKATEYMNEMFVECPRCKGSGFIGDKACKKCYGKGVIHEGNIGFVDIKETDPNPRCGS